MERCEMVQSQESEVVQAEVWWRDVRCTESGE